MADQLAYKPAAGEIPTNPGVYRFLDGDGNVLYVGKAKNLRQRLANYFAPLHTLHERTRRMVTLAEKVEWTVVPTDVDSLQLEYQWIKQFDPPFNVKYRDDKSYPFLAVTLAEEAPRVMVTRNRRIRGAKYFGPYPKVWAVRETIDLMLKVFPIRTCNDAQYKRAMQSGRPCFPGQIGKFHAKNKAKTGAPITKQKCGLKGGGCSQKFVRGSVHYKKSTGAHFTTKGSGIQRHWISQKQQNGTLGYPTGEVMRLKGVSSAFAQNFEGGTVVFKKSTGAHTVRGAIGSKWKKLGWARTSMKLPITAQKCTLVRGGCFQKFQGGSIHWSKKTGAHATKGAIQRAWGTQKYEKGRLGYPTSGEFTSGSLKRQNFEGGYITWSKKQGAKIRYR